MYPRTSFSSPLERGSSPTSTWQSGPITTDSTVAPFFACRFRVMRSPKRAGGCLNFQLSGIVVLFPGGSISPSGSKTSSRASCCGNRKQKLSLWVTRRNSKWWHSHFYPLIPGPVNSGYGRNSTINGCRSRAYTAFSGTLPQSSLSS